MLRNKRLTVALLFTVLLAGVFWSQSRIPALNEKAQMGLRTNFGAIAFEIVLPVSADQPLVERVFRTSINWAYTNWQGMAFGLLFAAAALTVLSSFQRRSFRQPWLNTLSGVAVGAKITIQYGGQAKLQQRKENKLSGGFMSFDNPAIHFGLGQYTAVDEVAVQWPDGETTVYQTPLPASGFYRIRRLSSSRSAKDPAGL